MAARARRDDAASPSAAQGLVTVVGPEPFGAGPCGDSLRAPSQVRAPSSMAVAEQLVITGRHTEAGLAAAIVRGFPVLLTVESAVQGRGTIESFEGAVAESDEAVHCLRSFGRPDHHGSRDRRPALRPEAA